MVVGMLVCACVCVSSVCISIMSVCTLGTLVVHASISYSVCIRYACTDVQIM